MKKTLKSALAIAAAIGGGIIGTQTLDVKTTESVTQQAQTQNNNDKQTPIQTDQSRVIVKQTPSGGLAYLPKSYGIPPHIYGQHYVRRGTHKKTNKK